MPRNITVAKAFQFPFVQTMKEFPAGNDGGLMSDMSTLHCLSDMMFAIISNHCVFMQDRLRIVITCYWKYMLILCTSKTWCDGGSLNIKIIIVIRSTLPERMSGLFRNAVAKISGIGKALPHSIFIGIK